METHDGLDGNRWNRDEKTWHLSPKLKARNRGERFDLWGPWALKANGRTFNVEARLVIYNVSLLWSHWLSEPCDYQPGVMWIYTQISLTPLTSSGMRSLLIWRSSGAFVHFGCWRFLSHMCVYYIYYATGTLEKKNSGCAILCITIHCWLLLVKHTCILRFGLLESAGTIWKDLCGLSNLFGYCHLAFKSSEEVLHFKDSWHIHKSHISYRPTLSHTYPTLLIMDPWTCIFPTLKLILYDISLVWIWIFIYIQFSWNTPTQCF